MNRQQRLGIEVPEAITERQWQTTLQDRLVEEGWAWNHVYRMKTASGAWRTSTTAVGWPDLVALRAPHILAIECKGLKWKAEAGQIEWLERFQALPTGLAWLLSPKTTDWQLIANWLHAPWTAPDRVGW